MTILDQQEPALETLLERKLTLNDSHREKKLLINGGFDLSQIKGLSEMNKERIREELTERAIQQ